MEKVTVSSMGRLVDKEKRAVETYAL